MYLIAHSPLPTPLPQLEEARIALTAAASSTKTNQAHARTLGDALRTEKRAHGKAERAAAAAMEEVKGRTKMLKVSEC